MLAVLNVTRGSRGGELWPSLSTAADYLFTIVMSTLLPESIMCQIWTTTT